ncbi:serine protease, partial [Verrucosispora sp. SN26_14.1]
MTSTIPGLGEPRGPRFVSPNLYGDAAAAGVPGVASAPPVVPAVPGGPVGPVGPDTPPDVSPGGGPSRWPRLLLVGLTLVAVSAGAGGVAGHLAARDDMPEAAEAAAPPLALGPGGDLV